VSKIRIVGAAFVGIGLLTLGIGVSPLLRGKPVAAISHPAIPPSQLATLPPFSQSVSPETRELIPRVYKGSSSHKFTRIEAKAVPLRVNIPSQGVDAEIVPAGYPTDPSGDGVPSNVHRIGWWGSKIGAIKGSIVLTGHINSRSQGIGAFGYLDRLQNGQAVMLLAGNRKTTYIVAAVAEYAKTNFPEKAVLSQDVPNRLVLITCGGPFDSTTGHYKYNIVVFAIPA
jgi:LPXTG-site transpeptidase (sortase) family protein